MPEKMRNATREPIELPNYYDVAVPLIRVCHHLF
jgi:hypothetical protein